MVNIKCWTFLLFSIHQTAILSNCSFAAQQVIIIIRTIIIFSTSVRPSNKATKMVKNIISILLGATALFGNLAFADPAIHISNQTCFGVTSQLEIQNAVITDSGMIKLIGDHSTDRWHI